MSVMGQLLACLKTVVARIGMIGAKEVIERLRSDTETRNRDKTAPFVLAEAFLLVGA